MLDFKPKWIVTAIQNAWILSARVSDSGQNYKGYLVSKGRLAIWGGWAVDSSLMMTCVLAGDARGQWGVRVSGGPHHTGDCHCQDEAAGDQFYLQ